MIYFEYLQFRQVGHSNFQMPMVHALSHLGLHTWGAVSVLFMLAVCASGSHRTSSEGLGFCQSRPFFFYVQLGRAKLFFRNNWEACLCRKVTSCVVDFDTAPQGGASFIPIWCFPLYPPVFQGWGSLYRMSSQILISGSFRETQTKAPASGNLDHSGEKTADNFKKWAREKYIMSYKPRSGITQWWKKTRDEDNSWLQGTSVQRFKLPPLVKE